MTRWHSPSPAVELLAPAGNRTCLRAAVANGADAVYFGLDRGFNARARAENFSVEDLDQVMDWLHQRHVRGYVTLNTLVFSDELAQCAPLIRRLAACQVDALLVQDLGLVDLIRRVAPELAIHASTQMTLSSAESIAVAQTLGIERVVLARELSIKEIAQISASTSMPLEVFVHGALCVAYSGQCLTSESLGGRSANRGQCAQACRLPYSIYQDGEPVELADNRFLLSPLDLAAHQLIPQLIEAGVCSLKIEGRLKQPEYVAAVTSRYRQALDAALARRPSPLTDDDVDVMEQTFSRGFSSGWLAGNNHKRLVPGKSSDKRGLTLGTVRRTHGRRVEVELTRDVRVGDGILFAGHADLPEQGGRIVAIHRRGRRLPQATAGQRVDLELLRGTLQVRQLRPGQAVWKTDDPQLTRALQKTFRREPPIEREPLRMHVRAHVAKELLVEVHAPGQTPFTVTSDLPLAKARNHPATESLFAEQLGRLGATGFRLDRLVADIAGRPMVPLSVLGKIRRTIVQHLADRDSADEPSARTEPPVEPLAALAAIRPLRSPAPQVTSPPVLHILCREPQQVVDIIRAGGPQVAFELTLDFQDIRQFAPSVHLCHESDIRVRLATPRIHKPGETGIFRLIEKGAPDSVLARNLAAMDYFRQAGLTIDADFSLNVANEVAARRLRHLGARRVTPSYDLNRDQLTDLTGAVPPEWLEIVVHQHVPMFHMEHCVFCAVLSPGTDKTNCGRPCDDHRVELEDRVGAKHLLVADVGCRNTLFNAQPQSGAEIVPELLARGIRDLRVELLPGATSEATSEQLLWYGRLLRGTAKPDAVWRHLRALNRVGVTRGTLETARDPLAIL